jgi:hypothetical protein
MYIAFKNDIVYCYVYNRYYSAKVINDNVKTHPCKFYTGENKSDYFKTDTHLLTITIHNKETRLIMYVDEYKIKYIYLVLSDIKDTDNANHIQVLKELNKKYYVDNIQHAIENKKLIDNISKLETENYILLDEIKYLRSKLVLYNKSTDSLLSGVDSV